MIVRLVRGIASVDSPFSRLPHGRYSGNNVVTLGLPAVRAEDVLDSAQPPKSQKKLLQGPSLRVIALAYVAGVMRPSLKIITSADVIWHSAKGNASLTTHSLASLQPRREHLAAPMGN